MKRICVFAGSNLGTHPDFQACARELGRAIADNGWELVYGGSSIGLMAEVANTVLEHGGKVIGVMPRGLFRGEMVHAGLSELVEVKDMHERKATMGSLSDAYVALPGGYGTLEELFEVVSWAQLGIHEKPIGLLNVVDYYTPILEMIDRAIHYGFMREEHKQLIVAAPDGRSLVEKLKRYERPALGNKWNQLT